MSCIPQSRGFSISASDRRILRMRTVTSALLVLALLPISSFATICELNCRAATTSAGQQPSNQAAAAGHHQHAASDRTMAGHACCPGARTINSASCPAPDQSAVQPQTTNAKFAFDCGVVEDRALLLPSTFPDQSRTEASITIFRETSLSSLPLRI